MAAVAAEGMWSRGGAATGGRGLSLMPFPLAPPPRRLGPCEGPGQDDGQRPAGPAHAVACSILLLDPSISPSPARADGGEEGSERKRDGGARAGSAGRPRR